MCADDHIMTRKGSYIQTDTEIEDFDEHYVYQNNRKSTSGSSGDQHGINQNYYTKKRLQGKNMVLDMIKNEL